MLAEPIAILEISGKPSLLTDMLTANTIGIQPLFIIKPQDAYIARKIIQLFSTIAIHAAQTMVANTYDANDKKCSEWQQVLSRQHRRQVRPDQQDTSNVA